MRNQITAENYHDSSRGYFHPLDQEIAEQLTMFASQANRPDSIVIGGVTFQFSFQNWRSTYFTTDSTLYRVSDHWSSIRRANGNHQTIECGSIRSCYWHLISAPSTKLFIGGYITFTDLTRQTNLYHARRGDRWAHSPPSLPSRKLKLFIANRAARKETAARRADANRIMRNLRRRKNASEFIFSAIRKVNLNNVELVNGMRVLLQEPRGGIYGKTPDLSQITRAQIPPRLKREFMPGDPVVVMKVADRVDRYGAGKYAGAQWVVTKTRQVACAPSDIVGGH